MNTKSTGSIRVLFLIIGGLSLLACRASADNSSTVSLDRDPAYERDLQWQAGNDKIMTPAKVLRWISSLRSGQPTQTQSNTEFVPIVNAHDGHLRVIAAIAHKF